MSDADFYGCYNPDHTKALNQTKCNASARDSWCCYIDDTCLDNGYCLQSSGAYSNRLGRGSCSDSTWSSAACPKFCADTRPSANMGLFLAFDRPNGAFCCERPFNSTTGECTIGTLGSTAPFDLPTGGVIYNRTTGAVLKPGLSLYEASTTSNSTAPAITANTTASDSASTSAASSSSNLVPVAVGIAVPLGILLIAALIACGLLFSQNRRLRREAQESRNAIVPEPKPHNYRQSVGSPAPMYEYRTDAGQTNWAPIGSGHAPQMPHQSGHYYAKVAAPEPVAQEVPAESIGELPGDKPAGR